jgi:Methyltransferase domain
MLKQLLNRETSARKKLLDALPKNGVGVEIGVWKGDFSAQLLKAAAPKLLHLVDPWIASTSEDRASEAWYGADKITQNGMDSIHDAVVARFANDVARGSVVIHRTTAEAALGPMAAASVDYVYVDGDHSYDGVTTDLALASRITRNGGLICADDYLLDAWWKDGVVRAIHELLVAQPFVIESKIASQIILRKL